MINAPAGTEIITSRQAEDAEKARRFLALGGLMLLVSASAASLQLIERNLVPGVNLTDPLQRKLFVGGLGLATGVSQYFQEGRPDVLKNPRATLRVIRNSLIAAVVLSYFSEANT